MQVTAEDVLGSATLHDGVSDEEAVEALPASTAGLFMEADSCDEGPGRFLSLLSLKSFF